MTSRQEELTRLVTAAKPVPFWLDRADAPAPRESLRGDLACDLAVIGGGFGGLWAALLAKEANPGRSVVLIEGRRVGWAASGRNGGFCEASLTHGAANGRERFPAELGTLQRLGAENLDAIEVAIGKYGIDCDFERAARSSRLSRLPGRGAACGRRGQRDHVPGRWGGAGRGELPHLPGGHLGLRRLGRRTARPGSPGAWLMPASGSASGSPSVRRPPAWPATRTA